MSKSDYLFVYGTLRQAIQHPMAGLLRRWATFVDQGYFQGRLYDLGSYPGAVASSRAADRVQGDIYHLHQTHRLLSHLDRYEHYFPDQPAQSLYLRQAVPIQTAGGRSLTTWIYLYNDPVHDHHLIECGDYLQYLQLP